MRPSGAAICLLLLLSSFSFAAPYVVRSDGVEVFRPIQAATDADSEQSVVPVAQNRYVQARADVNCIGGEDHDFDEEIAVDFGPFNAHVEASAADPGGYCSAGAGANQNSDIQDSKLTGTGGAGAGGSSGTSGQYGLATASAVSRFDVTFLLTEESGYSFSGIVSYDGECSSSGTALYDSLGATIHSCFASFPNPFVCEIDVSGVLAPGLYRLTARSSANGSGGEPPCYASANYNVTLAFESTTGAIAEESTSPRFGLRICPNPMRSDGTIEWAAENLGAATLRLFDAQGRLMLSRDLGSGTRQIRWADMLGERSLTSGVYFLELAASTGRRHVTRVIVTQ